MTIQWMQALQLLDTRVDELVNNTKDDDSNNYQLYIDLWKSISRKALVGRVTHLPTKKYTRLHVALPI